MRRSDSTMTHEILVTIKEGLLRGNLEKTHNGYTYFSFIGIPYAKPVVGDLKFKAPQPPQPWEGILEANKENNQCIGKDFVHNSTVGDFDCLYLNTYTPQLPQQNVPLKPVMVWIHGGAFVSGSKDRIMYDPEYFMDKDVVVVAINYRLGALGFLSLKDPKLGVSGNAGLKDQVMAMKWVQRNIAAFGGDPNNVTLFGESAGGAAVSYQLLSPMSKGLFHKAIIQSGVATCSWAEGHTDLSKELMKAMGKTASSEAEILAILENATRDELINAQEKVPDIWKPCKQRYLSPTVETSTSEERFLPDSPINILKSGNYNKVPVIIGATSNEGLLMNIITMHLKDDIEPANDAEYAPYWLNVSHEKAVQVGKRIKDHYYTGKIPSDENKQCYYDYISDTYFLRAIFNFAKTLIETSNNDVYLYYFDQVTNLNQFKQLFNGANYEGACHGEDLLYMFKTAMSPAVDVNSKEYLGIQRLTTWLTNFAKCSNPNGLELNPLLGETWPAATENLEYLNIDNTTSVKTNFGKNVTEFWDSIEAEC